MITFKFNQPSSKNVSAFCNATGLSYQWNNIKDFYTADFNECGKLCQKFPSCEVWSYSASQKLCWLKTTAGSTEINSNFATGFKTHDGNNSKS